MEESGSVKIITDLESQKHDPTCPENCNQWITPNPQEKRRHQSDMVQTYKILQGHDKVKSDEHYL